MGVLLREQESSSTARNRQAMNRSASVSRTLVKSPPELWAELSDPDHLAKHLGDFGEIRITRTEPEHTVAWEGESARGTVELEPAGWGTKVTLEAVTEVPEPTAVEPEPEPEPDPVTAEAEAVAPEPEPAPVAAARRRRWAFWRRSAPTLDVAQPSPSRCPRPNPNPSRRCAGPVRPRRRP